MIVSITVGAFRGNNSLSRSMQDKKKQLWPELSLNDITFLCTAELLLGIHVPSNNREIVEQPKKHVVKQTTSTTKFWAEINPSNLFSPTSKHQTNLV